MSAHPKRCRTCEAECHYERWAAFPPGQEGSYGVAWSCPICHGTSLDVCPVGPLVPARELCLNCGKSYATLGADSDCPACGLAREDCRASLGLGDVPGDPVAAARAAFEQGLFRRGLAIVNIALQEGAGPVQAWLVKAQFLHALGFNRSAAEMLEGAIARLALNDERVPLLEEQAFLWAECQRGEDALRSAESAVALGSKSVRTHYLRGRALGMVGRLEESRAEMAAVLRLEPRNAEALRAMDMIDGALRGKPGRRWWRFWRS